MSTVKSWTYPSEGNNCIIIHFLCSFYAIMYCRFFWNVSIVCIVYAINIQLMRKNRKLRLFCFNHQRLILRRFKALSNPKTYIISFLNSYCNSGKGKTPYGLLRRGKQKAFSFPQIFYNKKTNNLITFMKQNINYFDLINISLVVYD